MPIFEFRCMQCGKLFEKLFVNRDEKIELTCPQCHGDSLERVISKASYKMAAGKDGGPKITTKSCSSGNDCVTLEVPGHGD